MLLILPVHYSQYVSSNRKIYKEILLTQATVKGLLLSTNPILFHQLLALLPQDFIAFSQKCHLLGTSRELHLRLLKDLKLTSYRLLCSFPKQTRTSQQRKNVTVNCVLHTRFYNITEMNDSLSLIDCSLRHSTDLL